MSCWPTTSANNARHPARGSDLQRTADELQVSLALNSLKRKRSENIDDLISALIVSRADLYLPSAVLTNLQNAADPTVLSLIAKHNADNIAMGHLTNNDKVGLRALLAQMDAMGSRIREALGEVPPSKVGGVMRGQGIPVPDVPSPQDSAIADPDEKDNGSHPVTEPTPPSTIDHAEGSMELD